MAFSSLFRKFNYFNFQFGGIFGGGVISNICRNFLDLTFFGILDEEIKIKS
jgi:hypothetical protein